MREIRVLFLGNSHTFFHDMPQMFKEIYEATTGAKAEAAMLTCGGKRLEYYIKEYQSLRFALLYGAYDYCVIQQGAHPYPPVEDTLRDGKILMDWCNAVGTMPVLYVTWAEKAKPEVQRTMIETNEALHAMGRSLVSPVGNIWEALRKSHPEINLFHTDNQHASPYGDLLSAAVHCATILGSVDLRFPDHILDYGDEFRETGTIADFMSREARRVPADPAAVEAIRGELRAHAGLFCREPENRE